MNDPREKSTEPVPVDSSSQSTLAAAAAATAAGAPPQAPAATRQAAPPASKPAVASGPPTERLPENVAAMLTYLLGWMSGLAFLLLDRRPFVRYHAAQSVVVFATLSLLLLFLGDFFLAGFLPHIGGLLLVLRRIVELAWLAAAIVLMLKASSGERFRLGYAAAYGDRAAHSSSVARDSASPHRENKA